jgi:hypothetical protein
MKIIMHVRGAARSLLAGLLLASFGCTLSATAQSNSATAQSNVISASASKPVIVEWVYRTKYGYKDEWFRIFKKFS